MKNLPLLIVSAIGVCGALYACGSSSGDDDGNVFYDAGPDVVIVYDTGVDAPDPATGMGKAFCDATLGLIQNSIGQCCSATEKSAFSPSLQNTFSEIDTLVTLCETTLENSIAQHRTSPNTANYAACENAFKTTFVLPTTPASPTQCGGLDAYRDNDVISPSCAGAFTGKGIANDPCAGSFDCASGFACVNYGPTNDGKCLAPVPADGTCGIAAGTSAIPVDILIPPVNQCASGFFCDDNSACKPQYPNDGGPDGGAGVGCLSSFDCSGGVCEDTRCASGTPSTVYCASSSDCAPGSYCDATQLAPTDGGAPPGAYGTCASSKANAATCTTGSFHECQGKCGSGSCETYCGYPQ